MSSVRSLFVNSRKWRGRRFLASKQRMIVKCIPRPSHLVSADCMASPRLLRLSALLPGVLRQD
ncbi:hypothetical protein CBM2600_B10551 [Cupriavidus taiwanensis]|nr:hypothetical protein CBM2600_B10551 [Cupriavidus taiwanensis]